MTGDTVEVLLDNPQLKHNKIIGIVESVFDALTKTGEPDINLEIDIRYGTCGTLWFRYIPMRDGGSIKVLKKANK